jgi:hypothetical protein
MAITKVSSSLIDANLTITGGTVDDTVIGSGTPAAGTFTTIGGTLASSVTGTTQSAGDNSTKIATTGYVETALANMVDSAPSTLDTLNELAAALGDDPNFATTVTNSIALKAPLANPTFTGSFTSPGIDDNANAIAITIDSSENVGIGVSSAGTFRTKIKHSAASVTTGLGIEASANDSVLRIFHSGSLAGFNATYSSTGAYVPMVFNVGAGGEAMRIDTSGKLNIGGSIMSELLNVQTASSSATAMIEFRNTQSGTQIGMPANENALIIKTADAERMRIDSSGNVGIGAAPNTTGFGGTFKYLGVNGGSGLGTFNGQTSSVAANQEAAAFFGSTTGSSGLALLGGMQVINEANSASNAEGAVRFYTATGGSILERMRIDRSGNVGIGTSSPSSGTHSSYQNLVIGETTSATSGLSFKAATSGSSAIFFSDGASPFNRGQMLYDHSDDSLAFSAAGSEAMRIESSGSVAVGHSTAGGAKFAISDSGNATIQFFTEFSTDNNLTQHYDLTAAAYMSAETRASSFTWRLGTARAMAIDSSGTVMDYITSSGGNADLRYHTGTSVVSYDTSSERFKTNIRDNTTYGLAAVNALQSRMFEYKDDGRTDVGLIAEEVAEVVPELVGLDDENNPLTVDYKRFVSVLVKAMQEQQEQIEDLKAEVAALKGE